MISLNNKTRSQPVDLILRRSADKVTHWLDWHRYFSVGFLIAAILIVPLWTIDSTAYAVETKRNCTRLLREYSIKFRLIPDSEAFNEALALCRNGDTKTALNVLANRQVQQPPQSPEIVSFRINPSEIETGQSIKFYWEVKDADKVALYEDGMEIHGRFRLADGNLGWPLSIPGAFETTLKETSTFVLVAMNREGKTVKKIFTVRVASSRPVSGTCTISGKVYPKLRWRVKLSQNGDSETFVLQHIAVYRPSDNKLIRRTRVRNNGQYRLASLPAGRIYRIVPVGPWRYDHHNRVVACSSGTSSAENFRIRGVFYD